MKIKYGSIIDYSTVDYPGCTSSVVYLAGCPLSCGYCYTPFLLRADKADEQEVSFFIERFSRMRESIDAIVFSGGEPLMQGNALIPLCDGLKQLGFKIKIDTSGFYAEALAELIPHVDYVALEVKAGLDDAEAYAKLTACKGDPAVLLSSVLRSLTFLEKKGKNVFKEIKYIAIPGINDDEEAVESVAKEVAPYCDAFVLAQFDPTQELADPEFKKIPATSKKRLLELKAVAEKHVKTAFVKITVAEA